MQADDSTPEETTPLGAETVTLSALLVGATDAALADETRALETGAATAGTTEDSRAAPGRLTSEAGVAVSTVLSGAEVELCWMSPSPTRVEATEADETQPALGSGNACERGEDTGEPRSVVTMDKAEELEVGASVCKEEAEEIDCAELPVLVAVVVVVVVLDAFGSASGASERAVGEAASC